MITVISALSQTQEATEQALLDAGLKDGSKLTAAQIKTEKTPLFWFMKVTSKDASEKSLYVTYQISDLGAIAHGDGDAMVRRARVQVDVYSRNKDINSTLDAINNSFISIFKNFELRQIVYDTSLQVYNYSFIASANITELEPEEWSDG